MRTSGSTHLIFRVMVRSPLVLSRTIRDPQNRPCRSTSVVRALAFASLCIVAWALAAGGQAAPPAKKAEGGGGMAVSAKWKESYLEALDEAAATGKPVLVFNCRPISGIGYYFVNSFEAEAFAGATAEDFGRFVCLKLHPDRCPVLSDGLWEKGGMLYVMDTEGGFVAQPRTVKAALAHCDRALEQGKSFRKDLDAMMQAVKRKEVLPGDPFAFAADCSKRGKVKEACAILKRLSESYGLAKNRFQYLQAQVQMENELLSDAEIGFQKLFKDKELACAARIACGRSMLYRKSPSTALPILAAAAADPSATDEERWEAQRLLTRAQIETKKTTW